MLYNICYLTSNWRLYNQRGFCYAARCLLYNKKLCYIAHPNLLDGDLPNSESEVEAKLSPNLHVCTKINPKFLPKISRTLLHRGSSPCSEVTGKMVDVFWNVMDSGDVSIGSISGVGAWGHDDTAIIRSAARRRQAQRTKTKTESQDISQSCFYHGKRASNDGLSCRGG